MDLYGETDQFIASPVKFAFAETVSAWQRRYASVFKLGDSGGNSYWLELSIPVLFDDPSISGYQCPESRNILGSDPGILAIFKLSHDLNTKSCFLVQAKHLPYLELDTW